MLRPPHRRGRAVAASTAALVLLAACSSSEPQPVPDSSTVVPTASPSTVDPEREAGLDRSAVLGPLAFRPLAPVVPVVGSDGLRHYAYELTVINQSTGTATLTSVQPVTADRSDIGEDLLGERLATLFRVNGKDSSEPTLAPGGSATLFLDQTTDAGASVPDTIEHQVQLTFTPAAAGREKPKAKRMDLTGVPVQVDTLAPVVVSPPLRGSGWVVGNGCCSPINAHRGSTLSINGAVSVAQRFAIDFVQLTDQGRALTGDAKKVESYPAFGRTVYAAASGTVVGLRDGEKEQTPGALPADATIQSADGNYLVIDIGGGRYAFYAHMQPGTIKAQLGDRVETGDELGLLGNTGNTDAPHLHFHVMDGPSPLRSNGLPFVFDHFQGQGVLSDIDRSLGSPSATTKVPVDTAARAGAHADQMPLGPDLLGFDQ